VEETSLSPEPPAELADVKRAARGEVQAFERLYRRHVARIHSLARRLVGPGEADDATQEIFLRAWRRLETFRGEASFGTWLVRLAKNVLFDRKRRLYSAEAMEAAIESDVPAAAKPALRALDCEAALERLPEGARTVLVLHDVEGHTHQEIATLMGITIGTSKSQLHRARALVREMLADAPEEAKR